MKEIIKKNFRSVLSLVLVAAMVLIFAGCGQNQGEETPEPSQNQQEVVEKEFTFEVTELDGTKKECYTVSTEYNILYSIKSLPIRFIISFLCSINE